MWEEVGADPQLALFVEERKQRGLDAQAAGAVTAEVERKPRTGSKAHNRLERVRRIASPFARSTGSNLYPSGIL